MKSIVRQALAVTAVLAVAAPTAQALDKVVYGEQRALTAMTATVGVAKGFFEEQGIDLEIVYAQRGTDKIQAALAGELDFGYSGSPPIIAAASRGAPIVAVGLFSHGYSGILVASPQFAHLKDLAPKDRFEQLRGKRIGIQTGSGVATVFLMTIEKLGFTEQDFQITNMRVADMPAAMQGGSFDAVIGWEPGMSRIVASGFGEKIMVPEQFEEVAGVTYAFPIFTTVKLVEEQPDLVQRFMNAWARAQHFADTNREESMRLLKETLGDAITESGADLEALAYVYQKDRIAFTDADVADVQAMSEFMLKEKQIDTMPDLSVLIDNSFAEKAQREFGN